MTAAARAQAAATSRLRWLWPTLIILGLAGLSSELLFIGFILLIVPGLVLLVAPTAVIYGGVAELGALAWRRTHNASWVAVALAAGVALLAAIPAFDNWRATQEVAALTAGDFDHPFGAPVRTVALAQAAPWEQRHETTCLEACRQLLTRGEATTVIVVGSTQSDFAGGVQGMAEAYSLDPEDCHHFPPCLRQQVAFAPRVDAVVTVTLLNQTSRTNSGYHQERRRLDLFDPGVHDRDRLSVWRCGDAGCVETRRRTRVVVDRMASLPIVSMDIDNNGMWFHRDWLRLRTTVNPYDLRQVAAALSAGRAGVQTSAAPLVLEKVTPRALAALDAAAAADRSLDTDERKLLDAALLEVASADEAPARLTLMRRLLSQSHSGPISLWPLLKDHAAELAPYALELLADLRQAVAQEDEDRIGALEMAITALPDRELRRIGPSLLAFVADHPQSGRRSDEFWVRLADLGPAAIPAFRAGLNVQSPRAGVGLGVCKLGLAGGALAPDLKHVLSRRNDPSYQINPEQGASLGLMRMGRGDVVLAYLARYYPRTPPWYAQRLTSISPRSPAQVCDVPKPR